MTNKFLPVLLLALVPSITLAQAPNPGNEGGAATQVLLRAQSNRGAKPAADTIRIEVNGHAVPVAGLAPVQPRNTQVALLIDEGLSRSAGIQLNDLRKFATALPTATELFVGYMSNGRVIPAVNFTTDRVLAAKSIRVPSSLPGQSASPYFCLSDFVKHWPTAGGTMDLTKPQAPGEPLKARFVLMLTNGVDPYNGSVSLMNQNSPYVEGAALDAQRAGVPVYSIYYRDAAFRSGAASFSGQSYLAQIAEETGGQTFNQGSIDAVSLTPYLDEFRQSVGDTYIATFPAGAEQSTHDRLVQLKVATSVKGLKLRHPNAVMPGNLESTVRQ